MRLTDLDTNTAVFSIISFLVLCYFFLMLIRHLMTFIWQTKGSQISITCLQNWFTDFLVLRKLFFNEAFLSSLRYQDSCIIFFYLYP